MNRIALGADIGGSHITCQLFNLETSKPVVHTRHRIAVNSRASKNEILDQWIAAIRLTTKNQNLPSLSGIGFAMPGPFDYQNGIAWFEGVRKFEKLYGVNIREEIQNRMNLPADFPVRFLNDAACFAIGEAWLGEASNYHRIIALTMGTGFGTTFIKNKFPVAGKEGIPEDGFLYHIPFKNSIADDYFSTRWFLKTYFEKTGKKIHGVKELAEKAHNEAVDVELFREFGQNLGEFLVPWVKQFDANCLVLGGNISKSFPLFKTEMEAQLRNTNVNPTICPSEMEENAALFGSAKLCDNTFYSKLIKTKII
ncbi:glucokinase [Tangfeifania diversioriginum]|uniref:Glucokinase n=2 Tax=Tangfeifania diversioriginum TaxID=1168035 RepID=A0A1M6E263_9BACT|nr:glucokinase [Tangfeifania diversioriginum]